MKISDSTVNLTANSYSKSEVSSVKGEISAESSSSAGGSFDTASFSGTAVYQSDYVSYGDSVSYSTKNGKLQKNYEEESFSAVSESIVVTDDESVQKGTSVKEDASGGKMYLNNESFKLLAGLINKMKLFKYPMSGLNIEQAAKICIGTAQLKSASGTASKTQISAEVTQSSQTQGLDFGATGTIITDDGRQIDFSFDLSAFSSSADSSILNGSGALVYDKNGDGTISDSSELFGAKTGDGFAELAQYDDDGNGWIDEDDEIFDKLSVWVTDDSGEGKLVSLKEYGVGAIFTGSVQSSYTASGSAQVSKTGIYLKEDGSVGAVNHIDYTV